MRAFPTLDEQQNIIDYHIKHEIPLDRLSESISMWMREEWNYE